MKVYAIRKKQTNELIRFDSWLESKNPKFYRAIRFAKTALTNHNKSLKDYEIVEYELTNERVVQ